MLRRFGSVHITYWAGVRRTSEANGPALNKAKPVERIDSKFDFGSAFGASVINGKALEPARAFDSELVADDVVRALHSGPFLPANVTRTARTDPPVRGQGIGQEIGLGFRPRGEIRLADHLEDKASQGGHELAHVGLSELLERIDHVLFALCLR